MNKKIVVRQHLADLGVNPRGHYWSAAFEEWDGVLPYPEGMGRTPEEAVGSLVALFGDFEIVLDRATEVVTTTNAE